MAVLKYKSGDKIKTLGLVKSGVSGVSSVNGKTGAVTGVYDVDNQPPYPVTSVNGKTGAVAGVYDVDNQPPYPVTSVNGKTGVVNIEFVNGVAYSVGQSILKGVNYIHSIPINYNIPGSSVKAFRISFNVSSNYSILPISAFSPGKNGVGISVSNSQNSVSILIQNNDIEIIHIENITLWLYSLIDCAIAGVSQE